MGRAGDRGSRLCCVALICFVAPQLPQRAERVVVVSIGGIERRGEEHKEAIGEHEHEDGEHDHEPFDVEKGLRQGADEGRELLVQDAHHADGVQPDQTGGASDGRSKLLRVRLLIGLHEEGKGRDGEA